MSVVDLAQWLRAQLDEDERILREANTSPEMVTGIPRSYAAARVALLITEFADPARVLREIDAKRKRIALHQPEPGQHPDFCGYDRHELPCLPLRLEAAPYEDRPGYLEKWRP